MQQQHERCTVEGCGRKHKARGLCASHYARHLRGVDTAVTLRSRDLDGPETCTVEECSNMAKSRGLCAMHYARNLRHGHTRYTERTRAPKDCLVEGCQNHAYSKGVCHQHYMRARKAKTFGLSSADLAAIHTEQGGRCAICHKAEQSSDGQSGKKRELSIDHNHSTGASRGLLCNRCNRGLGYYLDDPALIAAAIAYLARHSADPASILVPAITQLQAAFPVSGSA